jgi:ribose transport system substrate-binding protein
MKKALLFFAATALVFAVGSANAADKKTLAVVVKGLDNGFFTVMGKGCADWNAQNADAPYTCVYTGPALTSDEAGEIQIVSDLIAKGVAGIAISPSNAPAMAKLLKEKADEIKSKKIAIMTIDADLKPEDQALRTTYFGTHNYGMGVKFCEWLKKLSPKGGKVALMFGNPAAENLNERGYGFRDCIQGEMKLNPQTTKGHDPLTGQGGWTEVAPTFTNDDIATANQQFADVLAANPDLTAYVLLGGWAQQGCEAFNATGKQYDARFKDGSLVVVAGDTVGCQLDTVRAGHSQVNVGQRPYQMGHDAPSILIDIIGGKKVDNPMYTGLDECTKENVDKCVSG